MPNQRDVNKTLIGAFIDRKLKKTLESIVKERGITLSDLVKQLLESEVKKYEKNK